MTSSSNSPLASIIVPLYKVEQHFAHGLQQLLSQTYAPLEILLIDDGSPDNIPILADEAAKNDVRVRTFHQSNAGVGAARNLGLDKAQGEYIFFYDIDDEISPTLVEECVREMEQRQVDFLCFGIEIVNCFTKEKDTIIYPEAEVHGEAALRPIYLETFALPPHGNGFLCNKAYRRSFLERHQLRIGKESLQEDEIFNLRVYPLVTSAYILPRILYTYYLYNSGNSRTRFLPNRFDYYITVREAFERLQKAWQISDSRFINLLRSRFRSGVNQALCYNLLHPDCPWSKAEKTAYIKKVMAHPYTQDALSAPQQTREQRFFNWVYRQENLSLLQICNSAVTFLHKLYRSLR